jgi:sulfur carrier protein ThiS
MRPPRRRCIAIFSSEGGIMIIIKTKMTIVMPDGGMREIEAQSTPIEDILMMLGVNPVEVIVAKNGRIVSECEKADPGDSLKIVRIVHGG